MKRQRMAKQKSERSNPDEQEHGTVWRIDSDDALEITSSDVVRIERGDGRHRVRLTSSKPIAVKRRKRTG